MSLMPVPAGHVAAVVTSLEMTRRPAARPMPESPLRLVRWPKPTPAAYRALFERIGAPWLWFSRLAMSDMELCAIIHHPANELYVAVDAAGVEVGMVEVDFLEPGACKLLFFGLVPELAGKGHGRWLMAHATVIGWRAGVKRMWVHTCTLDHPKALGFYRAQGFVPFARSLETFPDPRLAGWLPREAAPQIPLLGTLGAETSPR